jgi:amino acid adenylation domain-containing protein
VTKEQGKSPGAALHWIDQSDIPLGWNGPTNRPFDPFAAESKARPIIELLEQVVRRCPRRNALWSPGGPVTYTELWRAAAGCAEQIAASTAPGDLVAILAPAAPQFPIAMIACLAAGRPFVALDPNNPPEWIAQILDDARPALLLISGQDSRAVIPATLRTLEIEKANHGFSAGWRPAPQGPDDVACVLFTSGSTGKPKGIVNSQRSLLQRVSQSINAAHINSDDRLLTLTSLCTIVGVRDLITCLVAGASFFLIDPKTTGAREIHQIIHEVQISILFAFPALLRSVVASCPGRAADSLRLVRVGGDTTLWSDVASLRAWMQPNTSIQVVYAATEAPIMQWFVGEKGPEHQERVPIGYPLSGNALAIVDEQGAPTPEGDIGELLVRSPYVALGTWSQGRFQPGYPPLAGHEASAADGGARVFRTGDLVRRRPDGLYDRVGRKDRQVKVRGARVELDGVETALRRHPRVRDVGVVVRTDPQAGFARLVAYVQPDEAASDPLPRELDLMMRRIVPAHMRPWRYYLTPAIPRLPNSKLDTKGLLALDEARARAETATAPADTGTSCSGTDPLEAAVARIWRDSLGLPLTCPDDDFFDLGGDSLRALTLTFELEKVLGRNLPISLISQSPTFAAYCAKLRENAPVTYCPLVTLKPGEGTPLFFIHGAGGGVMELFGICRRMSWPGPVIGIQARGLESCDRPHTSVEAMAEEYITAIRNEQPQGPYLLCGYSFGGLVAFEVAQRLSRNAAEVAFLGLLATLPPGHHGLRLWTWTAYLYRQLTRAISRPEHHRGSFDGTPAPVDRSRAPGTPAALRQVALKALLASAVYRPGTYQGRLTVFEPTRRDLGVPSSVSSWRRYAPMLEHEGLQARHDDMLEGANAQDVANLLTRCLQAAARRPRPLSPPPTALPVSIAHPQTPRESCGS